MKKFILIFTLIAFALTITSDASAQRHSRYQRKKERVDRRIEEADRKGKLDPDEKADIERKERKMNQANRRAVRDGEITNGEQNKMNRRLRRVKRETRRSERD